MKCKLHGYSRQVEVAVGREADRAIHHNLGQPRRKFRIEAPHGGLIAAAMLKIMSLMGRKGR